MSATIYEFPVRGRFMAGSHIASSHREELKSGANSISSISPRVTKTVIGGSWYHEEAIQAERTPKN